VQQFDAVEKVKSDDNNVQNGSAISVSLSEMPLTLTNVSR